MAVQSHNRIFSLEFNLENVHGPISMIREICYGKQGVQVFVQVGAAGRAPWHVLH